jgi:hypothetical protein
MMNWKKWTGGSLGILGAFRETPVEFSVSCPSPTYVPSLNDDVTSNFHITVP